MLAGVAAGSLFYRRGSVLSFERRVPYEQARR
jgi:hypothetical protein